MCRETLTATRSSTTGLEALGVPDVDTRSWLFCSSPGTKKENVPVGPVIVGAPKAANPRTKGYGSILRTTRRLMLRLPESVPVRTNEFPNTTGLRVGLMVSDSGSLAVLNEWSL